MTLTASIVDGVKAEIRAREKGPQPHEAWRPSRGARRRYRMDHRRAILLWKREPARRKTEGRQVHHGSLSRPLRSHGNAVPRVMATTGPFDHRYWQLAVKKGDAR